MAARALFWLSALVWGVAAWPGKRFTFQGSSTTGWVEDFGAAQSSGGSSTTFFSNVRAYLVQNIWARDWWGGAFTPFHLRGQTLSFTVDLSNVGCGCIACLYFIPLWKPGPTSNYCDGQNGCIEIDIMEANMMAFHTALHTEGGKMYDGSCNANGCAANLGRYPYTFSGVRTSKLYGPGAAINSKMPFQVHASWDEAGGMSISLGQDGRTVPLFNKTSAGNFPTMYDGGYPNPWNFSTYPKPSGVPDAATGKAAWNMDQGLRLVASLWDGGNTFWLDHAACKGAHWCSLSAASFTVSDMQMGPTAGSESTIQSKFALTAVSGATHLRQHGGTFTVALVASCMLVLVVVTARRQVKSFPLYQGAALQAEAEESSLE